MIGADPVFAGGVNETLYRGLELVPMNVAAPIVGAPGADGVITATVFEKDVSAPVPIALVALTLNL